MAVIKNTVNIAFVTDCFKDTTAGAEKQIIELAKRLDKSDYNLRIISLDYCEPSVAPLIASIGWRLDVMRVSRIYGLSGLVQGIKFFRFLKQEKIDIVQTYHFGSDIWATLIARLAGVKAVVSNRRDMGFWRGNHHVIAYQWINQWVNKIVVNAESIKDLVLVSEGVPATHIEVIYNGIGGVSAGGKDIPVTSAHSVRQDLDIPEMNTVLMHVANLKPVKGHITLFMALKKILVTHPNVTLVLVGEDMLNGELQTKAAQLGIEKNIRFLGKRKDVGALLAAADIGVLPSLSEGMSNAILEYMIAAKPAVVTRVGGNSELVEDGKNGLLVEKENHDQMADALIRLIDNKALRVSMGAAGRQMALANFTVEGMLRRYEDLYDSLLPRKTRILHFISSKGFFGAENVLLSVAQNFNNDNYISCVSAIKDERQTNLEVIDRARAIGLPVYVFESRGRLDLQTIRDLKEFLLDNKIDILHTHNYKSDIIGSMAAENTAVALVSTAHGFTGMNSKVSWYEHLDRWFLKNKFDRTVVVTDQMLQDFPPEKRRVINNGIDFGKFNHAEAARQEIRNRYNIQGRDIVIGTVGRLSPEKNQVLLLAALSEICKKRSDIKIMVVGDGPEADALHGFVRATGIEDKVIFTGLISDTAPFYQAFDIFALSSRTEGVPLTVLEAMASRVPVVATKVGGIPQIITHDQTGLLVDPQNADQLRHAIETLIEDRQKRQTISHAAFDFAKQYYSIDRMKLLYQEVYQELKTK